MDPTTATARRRATSPGAITATASATGACSRCSTSSSCPRPSCSTAASASTTRTSSRRSKARGDDVLGHGRTNAEVLRGMWEHDEARVIAECTEVIAKHVGVRPTGWMGPGALESNVTPDLLKEAGYTHLLDWPVDDQPIWMRTRSGPLLSVPYPMELNDAGTQAHRDHTGREFADMIVDQFEEMLEQSERQPLVFALSLHGFIVGQPFRLRPLRQAIKHCVEKGRIASGTRAPATSRNIASRCRRASFRAADIR